MFLVEGSEEIMEFIWGVFREGGMVKSDRCCCYVGRRGVDMIY